MNLFIVSNNNQERRIVLAKNGEDALRIIKNKYYNQGWYIHEVLAKFDDNIFGTQKLN